MQFEIECTVCGRRYTQSHSLVMHSRIYRGEKLYKCYECDKAFSQAEHLNVHLRQHTGDKPFKCSLCDKSFTTSSDLRRHNVVYTATEDLMTVNTVGSCLKVMVN